MIVHWEYWGMLRSIFLVTVTERIKAPFLVGGASGAYQFWKGSNVEIFIGQL